MSTEYYELEWSGNSWLNKLEPHIYQESLPQGMIDEILKSSPDDGDLLFIKKRQSYNSSEQWEFRVVYRRDVRFRKEKK
jgi:hypothetical protein